MQVHYLSVHSRNANRTSSAAVEVGTAVQAYRESTEQWQGWVRGRIRDSMDPAERASFDTVRGLVQSIEELLESNQARNIPAHIILALKQDLIVRRAVSAVYLRRSVGADPNSPLEEGNRRHRFWQSQVVQITGMMERHNIRAIRA